MGRDTAPLAKGRWADPPVAEAVGPLAVAPEVVVMGAMREAGGEVGLQVGVGAVAAGKGVAAVEVVVAMEGEGLGTRSKRRGTGRLAWEGGKSTQRWLRRHVSSCRR